MQKNGYEFMSLKFSKKWLLLIFNEEINVLGGQEIKLINLRDFIFYIGPSLLYLK